MELFAVFVVVLAAGGAIVMLLRRPVRSQPGWSPSAGTERPISGRSRWRHRPDRRVRWWRRAEHRQTLEER